MEQKFFAGQKVRVIVASLPKTGTIIAKDALGRLYIEVSGVCPYMVRRYPNKVQPLFMGGYHAENVQAGSQA